MRTAAMLSALLLSGCVPGADWPRWRGPHGSAVLDGAALPVSWSAADGVAWSVVIPGEGSSSPIVIGDLVVVTSALESGGRRVMHGLDRRTGATRWTLET